ncbi:hypothetical protein MTQ13_03220 [Streptomyces sp. XM4011]|uniref:hypothetical protein n=1 Tax=Streptomyces sp. XM4011 TaxID=2929780 RepID=UPI001FF8F259|nr:hypothetical protein [Streptomyces sp. XM4011]MCK1813292.1 hypothetical protein [Streptomyces sp. XM4011]
MTVAEFIVETQWTLLLLIILLPLIIGMIANREFRAAILNRRVSVSTSGIEMEPSAATTAALATATASDEEVAAAISEEEAEPAKPEEVTAVRREAVEELVREAAHFGARMQQAGYEPSPVPLIRWDAPKGPSIQHTPEQREAYLGHVRQKMERLLESQGRRL